MSKKMGLKTYFSNTIEAFDIVWRCCNKWIITPYKWDMLGYPLVNFENGPLIVVFAYSRWQFSIV